MKRRILLALPAAAAVLTLAGCVTGQPPLFERYGRFALVSTSASGEREAVNGRFSLRRTSAGLRLNLMTPLNGILASIEVTPSGAVLETSQNESPLRPPPRSSCSARRASPFPSKPSSAGSQ